jgi:hypothetical protein
VILLIAFICTYGVGVVLAQERVPGVSVGNEFTFSERSFWFSSDPNNPQPVGLADVNLTEYYRVTVTRVSGSNVSTHTRWHFTNGTDVENDGSVSTETTAYQGGFWTIIGSNLNATNRLHPKFKDDLSTFNETVTWDYDGYQRQTNHLTLVFNYEDGDNPASPTTESVDTYFDRQTGALVQLIDNHAYNNPETTLAVTWRLVSQNAWTGSDTGQDLPLLTITTVLVVVFSVLFLSIFVYRRTQAAKRKFRSGSIIEEYKTKNTYFFYNKPAPSDS